MKVKQQWFRKMDIDGSSMKIQDIALAADGAGSLYFVGQEQDGKIFLTKMSRSGNELWRKQVSTPQDSGAWLFSLATDGHGNIYLTGTITVAAEAGQPSRRSAWLAKFSSDGTELWQRALAGQNDWGIHLAADGAGSIYLVGGAGAAVGNNFDTWLAKISAAGDELWRRELGRQQVEYYALGAVAADWAGNVCFLGVTERIATAGQKNARAVKFSRTVPSCGGRTLEPSWMMPEQVSAWMGQAISTWLDSQTVKWRLAAARKAWEAMAG